MKLTIQWNNKQQVLAYLRRMRGAGPRASQPWEEAVGKAAIRVQDALRHNLETMIYAQPKAVSGYVRTRTLYRSAHAANPANKHSGDEARASSGEDLVATDPKQVVEMRGDTIASHIGSWISYAPLVHDGINQSQKRPFLSNLEQEASKILDEEVTQAIIKMTHRR